MKNLKYLAMGEIAAALGVTALGLWGVITDQVLIRKNLYFLAWYPLIGFLDGMLYILRGESWLWGRPRILVRMGFWSVTVWLLFEACNLAMKNWGYEGLVSPWWLRWPGYIFAFATVLPGILITTEVLRALGAFQRLEGRTFNLGRWQPLSLVVGVVFLVLPVVFPRFTFPLVWGAFFFLLEPFCDLLGEKSLIADFAKGLRGEHLCLLTAGLICGLWWEAWNYGALSKWVYTLPVLNFGKIFEMPVLGYLGFPPFALECAVMYNFMKAMEERVLVNGKRRQRAYLLQVAFWLVMFAAVDAWTVRSFQ